jgi:hypothetical protein
MAVTLWLVAPSEPSTGSAAPSPVLHPRLMRVQRHVYPFQQHPGGLCGGEAEMAQIEMDGTDPANPLERWSTWRCVWHPSAGVQYACSGSSAVLDLVHKRMVGWKAFVQRIPQGADGSSRWEMESDQLEVDLGPQLADGPAAVWPSAPVGAVSASP